MNPEGLWDWMDSLRTQGIESLAIPHNSNGSNGAMFAFTDWAGKAIDQGYANQRLRNEPLVEITQVKGTSDTHPLLSKNDEWADFELMEVKEHVLRDLDQAPLKYSYKNIVGQSRRKIAAQTLGRARYRRRRLARFGRVVEEMKSGEVGVGVLVCQSDSALVKRPIEVVGNAEDTVDRQRDV